MSETLTEISKLVNSFTKQRAELVERLRNEFQGLFIEVFEKTDVGCFYWTQYTPYFNDGEPCEFRMGEIAVLINETPEERYWEDCEQYPNANDVLRWKTYLGTDEVPSDYLTWYPTDEECLKGYRKCTRREAFEKDYAHKFKDVKYVDLEAQAAKAQIVKNTLDALSTIPEDMFEELFGDHVSVRVDRTGVHVDDYDHD